MASIDHLPHELLSSINAYAADWIGLESLLEISPRVRALFAGDANNRADTEAIRLVESILRENPIMKHELHCYFRMCTELHQSSLADESLAGFMARDHSVSLITSSITRATLREIVSVAANIQRLACACLTTLLARLRRVRPRRWTVDLGLSGKHVDELAVTTSYETRDAGPPSWIEEYRVYRALWHLQLCSDLLVVADRLGWAESDRDYLRSEHMKLNQLPDIAADEIFSVKECLENLSRTDTTHSKPKTSDMTLITKMPIATELFCEFEIWSPPHPPILPDYDRDGDGNLRDVWGRGPLTINKNPMANIWRSWQVRTKTRPVKFQKCSLQDSRFWRALGMPLWDLWRSYGLGLCMAVWPVFPFTRRVLTPDGIEVPSEADPPAFQGDTGYRLSTFIEARMQMELQEWLERTLE